MKATGIVRRIDDLGRVVIPKEIRRTMRIREGDPLEIYTDNDGAVIFKKYSPIGELSGFATQIAESVSKNSSLPILICDRDHCVATAGISKKEVLERRVSQHAEDFMDHRTTYVATTDANEVFPLEGIDRAAAVFMPILSAGDVVGAVVMLQSEKGSKPKESDEKMCSMAAMFLGKIMEE